MCEIIIIIIIGPTCTSRTVGRLKEEDEEIPVFPYLTDGGQGHAPTEAGDKRAVR